MRDLLAEASFSGRRGVSAGGLRPAWEAHLRGQIVRMQQHEINL